MFNDDNETCCALLLKALAATEKSVGQADGKGEHAPRSALIDVLLDVAIGGTAPVGFCFARSVSQLVGTSVSLTQAALVRDAAAAIIASELLPRLRLPAAGLRLLGLFKRGPLSVGDLLLLAALYQGELLAVRNLLGEPVWRMTVVACLKAASEAAGHNSTSRLVG